MAARNSNGPAEAKQDTRMQPKASALRAKSELHPIHEFRSADVLVRGSDHPGQLVECQHWLKDRLTDSLLEVFERLTGVPLHLAWTQAEECPGEGAALLCHTAQCSAKQDLSFQIRCRACLERRWVPALSRPGLIVRFTGSCGLTNVCLCVRAGGLPLLWLVLQAQGMTSRLPAGAAELRAPKPCRIGKSAKAADGQLDAEAFERAESLLRLICHDLETTCELRLAQRELAATTVHSEPSGSKPRSCRTDANGLVWQGAAHKILLQPLGRHARLVVQAMLDYVRDHYHRPMALKEVAGYLGMNANYLSGLFHRSTGITFHRCLLSVRMSKAEELLRDPRARMCEVASAVGYASPNHFRNAFRARERLSRTGT